MSPVPVSNWPRLIFKQGARSQKRGVRSVRAHSDSCLLTPECSEHLGAVAQLGERLICIQEVAGSIPTSSTSVGFTWARSSDG